MASDYVNPKCPDCGRCIDVHYNDVRDAYYCPTNSCQTYWSPDEVVP